MKDKFIAFLESLKGEGQDTLIESVKKGFDVCYENDMNSSTKYTCPGCGEMESESGNKLCDPCVEKAKS